MLRASSTYDPQAQTYVIHYDFTLKMDSSKIVAPLTVRYFLADSSYTDVDTTVALYKYPYKSAEVFVTPSTMIHPGDFGDVARTDSFLFFHPMGFEGAYEYSLVTHQTRLLVNNVWGSHIWADSAFAFFDSEHEGIYRYDLRTNTNSLWIRQAFPGIIEWLDVFKGNLFVHLGFPPYTLRIFTFNGLLADSIEYSLGRTRFIAINDSIVYGVEFPVEFGAKYRISRFDLRTRTFRSHVKTPAKKPAGIKTYGNQLYYVDYNKRFVGAVPIADLIPTQ